MHQKKSKLKKITEDILQKTYREKSVITDRWLVLSSEEVRKEFAGFEAETS